MNHATVFGTRPSGTYVNTVFKVGGVLGNHYFRLELQFIKGNVLVPFIFISPI
jgi:hypothetical protein